MTHHNKNGITEGVIWKQLLLFFFPILIGSFFQQLYNTVDTIIVGQYVGKEVRPCKAWHHSMPGYDLGFCCRSRRH